MARRRYLALQLQHSRNETHVDGFQTATEVQMHCLRNTRQCRQLSVRFTGRVAKTAVVSLATVGKTTKIVVKIGANKQHALRRIRANDWSPVNTVSGKTRHKQLNYRVKTARIDCRPGIAAKTLRPDEMTEGMSLRARVR